jgi:hypothetical protein
LEAPAEARRAPPSRGEPGVIPLGGRCMRGDRRRSSACSTRISIYGQSSALEKLSRERCATARARCAPVKGGLVRDRWRSDVYHRKITTESGRRYRLEVASQRAKTPSRLPCGAIPSGHSNPVYWWPISLPRANYACGKASPSGPTSGAVVVVTLAKKGGEKAFDRGLEST